MPNKRRDFIKLAGLTGIGMAGGALNGFSLPENNTTSLDMDHVEFDSKGESVIGLYGPWANSLNENKLPSHSFRRDEYKDVDEWRKLARQQTLDRMAIPDIGRTPEVTVEKKYSYDGLDIEELSWQLPYGRKTEAYLLKPQHTTGKLPGILAFHDHGGNKYFGRRKITRTSASQHPLMVEHQKRYYLGTAWANEIAKRGYVVLVSDAFTFASRRVMLQDVPERLRNGHTDNDPENPVNILAYNNWAADHEHIMAKSLFSAGTTWPAVFFAEDQKALDVLCGREEVDAERIGCGGLSGGGIRTVYMAGLEPRIKCAVDVGFLSTWKDFILNRSFIHTWMTYVPLLPNELDFPEILGLRAPLPTLVLDDINDDLYTLPEMKRGAEILTEVYKKAGAPENFHASFYPGPHKFDPKMQTEAFAWFDRWLKA